MLRRRYPASSPRRRPIRTATRRKTALDPPTSSRSSSPPPRTRCVCCLRPAPLSRAPSIGISTVRHLPSADSPRCAPPPPPPPSAGAHRRGGDSGDRGLGPRPSGARQRGCGSGRRARIPLRRHCGRQRRAHDHGVHAPLHGDARRGRRGRLAHRRRRHSARPPQWVPPLAAPEHRDPRAVPRRVRRRPRDGACWARLTRRAPPLTRDPIQDVQGSDVRLRLRLRLRPLPCATWLHLYLFFSRSRVRALSLSLSSTPLSPLPLSLSLSPHCRTHLPLPSPAMATTWRTAARLACSSSAAAARH